MSKIRVMSRELSNRIAAGEVVERPASVVKELVENSIDAGATQIDVAVEKAGLRLIRVRDNGCGMDSEDALLALEPHGTSKLINESDIEHICTMGFRGEAIPSVAAVSDLTIRTRTADERSGTEVKVSGGSAPTTQPCGGPVGTTIEVENLFFNTPARKKFLKSDPTEERHIEDAVISLALGNPALGISLTIDRKKVLDCAPGASLELRVREFFGRSYAANLRPVDHRENHMHITGLVAAPGFDRPARKEQRFFLNHRPIESPILWRAVKSGYGTIADEAGRFPPVILFIELPPEEFDINVHPAKREVRFKSEYVIGRAISTAIANALCRNDGAVALPPEAETPALPASIPVEQILQAAQIRYEVDTARQLPLAPVEMVSELETAPEVASPTPPVLSDQPEPAAQAETPVVKIRAKLPEEAVFAGNWPTQVLGIYDKSFILSVGGGELVIVDQHAAHERILFEEILDKLARGANAAQMLLIGQVVELSPVKVALLMRNRQLFEQLGFAFESVGRNEILVSALPENFHNHPETIPELFDAMLEELLENAKAQMPVNGEFAARAACRAAVKAHDDLTISEAEALLVKLRNCRQGTLCPHGRPTMITITRRELERRFWRR